MKECPRCYKMTLEEDTVLNSLSRRDSRSYICSTCGKAEAMFDLDPEYEDNYEAAFCEKLCESDELSNGS